MGAIALGAFLAALIIGWLVKHSHRDYQDWRGSVARAKENRSVFFGGIPRAALAVAVGVVILRLLF